MQDRVDWRAVGVFVGVSYGLGALAAAPLLLIPEELRALLATVALMGMMFTPSLAVWVVHTFVAPLESWREELGLRRGERLGSTLLAGWLGTPLLVLATVAVAGLLGWLQLDLIGLSGMAETLEAAGAGEALDAMPPHALLAAQLVQGVLLGAVINFVFAMGEELGWRGWLLPKLMPLGTLPALVVSGAIWGLWHTPAIWAGHNFPDEPVLGPIVMMVACMGWGVWLGWLRLRSGSVLVPALAHGVLNGTAGIVVLVHQAGSSPDPLMVLPVGVAGALVMAGVSGLLWVTGALSQPTDSVQNAGANEA